MWLYSNSMGSEFALLGKGDVKVPHWFQEQMRRPVYLLQIYQWCLCPSNLLDHRAARGSARQYPVYSESSIFDTLASFVCIWFIHKIFFFSIHPTVHSFHKVNNYYVAGFRPGDGNVVVHPIVLLPAFLELTVIRGNIKEINTQRNTWLQTMLGALLEKRTGCSRREWERTG